MTWPDVADTAGYEGADPVEALIDEAVDLGWALSLQVPSMVNSLCITVSSFHYVITMPADGHALMVIARDLPVQGRRSVAGRMVFMREMTLVEALRWAITEPTFTARSSARRPE
jgi:hypothetical protein